MANIYGTKCSQMVGDRTYFPLTLKQVYDRVIQSMPGIAEIIKPYPGLKLRKRKKPLTEMDGPRFRRLPAEVVILTPPRLFRSHGWKYRGNVYLECEVFWECQLDALEHDVPRHFWESIFLINNCYERIKV